MSGTSLRRWLAAGLGALASVLAAHADAATLYIREYASGSFSSATLGPPEPAIADQVVALSGTSAQSAAFNAKTHFLRLICDEGCSVLVGTNPVATTLNFMLQQGVPIDIGVPPGYIVAAIANAAGNTSGGGGGAGQLMLDSTGQSILAAVQGSIPVGSNIIGKVGIDQTTPGTTNGVSGTSTAADATALTLLLKDFSLGGVYNGATVDMLRGGDVNNVAAATGYANALAIARYNATAPTLTDTRYNALQVGARGSLRVEGWANGSGVPIGNPSSGADGASNSVIGWNIYNYPASFNGATWDRQFLCPTFAAVSVTAGNTTQIVALSGSTVIRICNADLSISVSGSFDFISGTGANCGTPANDTGAVAIAAGTLQNITGGGPGMAVYRGTAGGEFCVKATTGNVTGWVMYAQY